MSEKINSKSVEANNQLMEDDEYEYVELLISIPLQPLNEFREGAIGKVIKFTDEFNSGTNLLRFNLNS